MRITVDHGLRDRITCPDIMQDRPVFCIRKVLYSVGHVLPSFIHWVLSLIVISGPNPTGHILSCQSVFSFFVLCTVVP